MGIRRSASEYGSAVGDEQVAVSNAAIGITAAAGAVAAMVTNGAEPIRVRWGTPTASVGHYLNPYSVLDLYEDDMSDVKFIRVSSDSTVDVTYFG
ncbi:MAG: hypothetical protein QF565_09280 [Arenicellales bacterium]|jgi:hypothetical protein|nr:hypothetical protein [Arenicellales bacterium]|tara:strand:+ start:261 stop:545 length:285 start_codon:yes stop_codon:yes gene_type:complete